MINVLVVDDDKNICKLIATFLMRNGYDVMTANNGLEALDLLDRTHFDLIVADIMMPKMDGYTLTSDIRSIDDKVPILMVSAKYTLADKQKGFLSGIDDYMSKPIDLEEMLLRVTALLRRAKISAEQKIEIGDLKINSVTRTIKKNGQEIELPKKEFELLYKLLSYPKKIFTRRQLMDEIWGMDSEADERTVDVHIKRLREKFLGFSEFEIITSRGLGYKAERKI